MELSVIIPTYNRRDLIARTLPTVLAQDLPREDWEIIVVVDGSTDGTAEYLRGLEAPVAIRVIEQPNRGPGAARNAGLRAARGEIALLLDDDSLCEPSFLRQHLAAHNGLGPCVVFGPTLIARESRPGISSDYVTSLFAEFRDRLVGNGGPRSAAELELFSNCSAPRGLLVDQGGYDESVRWFEATMLARSLWASKVQIRFLPEAIVRQLYSKSASDMIRIDGSLSGTSQVRLARKLPGFRRDTHLAWMLTASPWRPVLARFCCTSPISSEAMLRVPFRIVERMSALPGFRRAAIRMLALRLSIAALRSAVEEAGSWQALRREFGLMLPVLMYHHIGVQRQGTFAQLTVSPALFERQMRWLADHGYVGITPSQWLAWCRESAPLPERPVLITFDDGYADIADYALPVLKRYGFGGAVFLVTGRIGGTNAWDEQQGSAAHRLLTEDQIRRWSQQGIEFGSHSRTHPDLTKLDAQRLADEVEGSRDDLAEIIGARPCSFAYPFGTWNEPVLESVRRTYDLALGCIEGMNGLPTDIHQMRRTMVLPTDGMLDFACRVRFGRLPLAGLRARLGLRTRAEAVLRSIGSRSEPAATQTL
jgi:glycosyltransferase involved in cell wall biosynthesis/peptidoglycan/xylan/chitin deacetylase (PgdA/CDA1 family)